MCCASAALPPLPHHRTLLPARSAATTASTIASTCSRYCGGSRNPRRSARSSSKSRRPWYRAIASLMACGPLVRLDPEKLFTLRDQLAVTGDDAHDRTGVVALNLVEELHGFEHAQDVADFDAIAHFDVRAGVG